MTYIVLILLSFLYAVFFIINDHLEKENNAIGIAPSFLSSFVAVLLLIIPIHMGIKFTHHIFYVAIINVFGILIYFISRRLKFYQLKK